MKTVREILDSKQESLATIPPGASVLDATKLMSEKNIGALLVIEGDRLIGLISERDVAYKLVCVGDSATLSANARFAAPATWVTAALPLATIGPSWKKTCTMPS